MTLSKPRLSLLMFCSTFSMLCFPVSAHCLWYGSGGPAFAMSLIKSSLCCSKYDFSPVGPFVEAAIVFDDREGGCENDK
jgi:acetyl-CoA carboxylase alpha subunit